MFDTSVCLQGFGLVPDLVPLGSSWLTVAGSVRSSQEEPGGARRNQEEPGDAARRSWKESMRGAQEKPGKSTCCIQNPAIEEKLRVILAFLFRFLPASLPQPKLSWHALELR